MKLPSFIQQKAGTPIATVVRSRYAKGISAETTVAQASSAQAMTIWDAILTPFATDAHVTTYHATHATPQDKTTRVNKNAVGHFEGMRLTFWGMVFDADLVQHKKRWSDYPDQYEGIKAKAIAHLEGIGLGRASVYQTRGGMHVYVLFDAPWEVKCARGFQFYESAWAHICAMIAPAFDGIIAMDASTGDWTRLYRLPRVYRDGVDIRPHDIEAMAKALRPTALPDFTLRLAPKARTTYDYGATASAALGDYTETLPDDHPFMALCEGRLAQSRKWQDMSTEILGGCALPLDIQDGRHKSTLALGAYLAQGKADVPLVARLLWPCWVDMVGEGERVGEFVKLMDWIESQTHTGISDPVLSPAVHLADYGPDLSIIGATCIALDWGLGSGKTYQLEKAVKGKRALIVVPLKTLAANVAARLDAVDYQTCKGKGPEFLMNQDRIVVSIPALARLPFTAEGKVLPWEVVCVDEVVQCLDQLFAIHVEQSVPALRVLRDACATAKSVIFCDAHFDEITHAILERSVMQGPILRHRHRGRDIFDTLHIYANEDDLVKRLRRWLANGERCYVACTSKAQVEWLEHETQGWHVKGIVKAYHSAIGEDLRSDIRHPDASWANVQCVLTSPTIGSGVSYDPPDAHFDRVLLFGSAVQGIGHRTLLQMTGRVRWPRDRTLHAWVSETEYDFTTDPKALEDDQHARMRLAWSLASRYAKHLARTRDLRIADPLLYADWLYAQTQGLARVNYDANAPRANLIRKLRARGVQPVLLPSKTSANAQKESKKRKRDTKAILKARKVAKIVEATPIDIADARLVLRQSSTFDTDAIASAHRAFVQHIYGYVDPLTVDAEWGASARYSATMRRQATLLTEHAAGRLTLERMVWGPLGADTTEAAWAPFAMSVLEATMPTLFGNHGFGLSAGLERLADKSPDVPIMWGGDPLSLRDTMRILGATRREVASAVAEGEVRKAGNNRYTLSTKALALCDEAHPDLVILPGSCLAKMPVAGVETKWQKWVKARTPSEIKRALPPGFDHPARGLLTPKRIVTGTFLALGLPLAGTKKTCFAFAEVVSMRLVWLAKYKKALKSKIVRLEMMQFSADRQAIPT